MPDTRQPPAPIIITDVVMVGDNPVYSFCVGRTRDKRWLGFARARIRPGRRRPEPTLFLLPEVSEGFCLGVKTRAVAIRLTGAVAQDPACAYGGIKRWFVPPALRGKPGDFRCGNCGGIGCTGEHCYEWGSYTMGRTNDSRRFEANR